MKRNKINTHINTYPRPIKATKNLDLKNLNKINTLQKINNNCTITQSERPAEMSDPELSGALLNSVSYSFKNERDGRVTAVVATVKFQQVTKNQAKQRVEHSARCCPSNKIIQVLLDSGSDGDLMFHEKGTPMHFPYLARQVPNSWYTSNGSFLTK